MPRPTAHQLDILETYATTGDYQSTATALGISRYTVRNTLVTVRVWYGAKSSIQAYHSALEAGHLARPRGRSAGTQVHVDLH